MKKVGLINQPLSHVIAGMGHLDAVVISDAGLPIPAHVQRVDLAIKSGMPPFIDVLQAVLSEMQVESAIVAAEIKTKSSDMHRRLVATLGDIPIRYVSHDHFKQQTHNARAIVRSGEFTPFSNVILVAGVVF